jgi:DNA-directed RNA polymerase subunit alpha
MRIRWRDFELPTRVVLEPETASDSYGMFYVEPFERGFGTTVGNSMRRVLLSSLEGTAVTSVKIEGVLHEFTPMEGALEDVTDVILNIKNLLVRLDTDERVHLKIEVDRKGAVTAADIQPAAHAEVINPDLHIVTMTEKRPFVMEMEVGRGRGYVTAEENTREDQEIGRIPVDSIFSPVRRVRYRVENTRVGKLTNYDKLILEVWTNGTIHPEMAVIEAGKILRKHLNPFVHVHDIGAEIPAEERFEELVEAVDTGIPDLADKLSRPISDLDLSVRASNCLAAENIFTIGELVRRTEAEMLEIRNFGKTSLKEVQKKLTELGLSLGMSVDMVGKDGGQ